MTEIVGPAIEVPYATGRLARYQLQLGSGIVPKINCIGGQAHTQKFRQPLQLSLVVHRFVKPEVKLAFGKDGAQVGYRAVIKRSRCEPGRGVHLQQQFVVRTDPFPSPLCHSDRTPASF